MTDFEVWATQSHGAPLAASAPVALFAVTPDGPIRIASGSGVAAIAELPADRLALGPVTLGGMVMTATPSGHRTVCVDASGDVELLDCDGQQVIVESPDLDDLDAVALLWRLQDSTVTAVEFPELLARLLLWAWLDHPARSVGATGPDPGVDCFVAGDLRGLATLLGADVPPLATINATALRVIADDLGHPPLAWELVEGCDDEDGRLRYLTACLPARWQVADELRTIDRRDDLADAVMAAPTLVVGLPST